MEQDLSPENIINLGNGFKAAKVLLTAVELGVFTELAGGPRSLEALQAALGLSRRRSTRDFFDALVSLKMLRHRDGHYSNTRETDTFLDRNKPTYIGGLLEMYNHRLYRFWGDFTEGLKTGNPQNEARNGEEFFAALYADPDRLKEFLRAMAGISLFTAKALAKKFPWQDYKSFADIGCAQGVLAAEVVTAHPHLQGIGFDLEPVQSIFNEYIAERKLTRSLSFQKGDFFSDDLPQAEVLVFGQILHDWSLDQRKFLLAKAYRTLPQGGALIVYEPIIDDERRENTFGLLSSLTMLIETRDGFDYTGRECCEWMQEAGFQDLRVQHLVAADSMVVGIKC
jgi:SAM-dependent methyltransferase